MNVKEADLALSKRLFVHRKHIINSISLNKNCCGTKSEKVQIPSKIISHPKAKKSSVELVQQIKDLAIASTHQLPLFDEIASNAWPISNERVEHFTITNKRCQFSNEAISIKPITAVPGIGKKYGQLLADHGFIYARQLLGYYMILKDSEMFRKWLEYRFGIPRFRAAEITSALNEFIRRTL